MTQKNLIYLEVKKLKGKNTLYRSQYAYQFLRVSLGITYSKFKLG